MHRKINVMNEQNEIVLYQPNELTKLEVRLAGDYWFDNSKRVEDESQKLRSAIE